MKDHASENHSYPRSPEQPQPPFYESGLKQQMKDHASENHSYPRSPEQPQPPSTAPLSTRSQSPHSSAIMCWLISAVMRWMTIAILRWLTSAVMCWLISAILRWLTSAISFKSIGPDGCQAPLLLLQEGVPLAQSFCGQSVLVALFLNRKCEAVPPTSAPLAMDGSGPIPAHLEGNDDGLEVGGRTTHSGVPVGARGPIYVLARCRQAPGLVSDVVRHACHVCGIQGSIHLQAGTGRCRGRQ